MALAAKAVTVTAAATRLDTAESDRIAGRQLIFFNNSGVTIFVGGATVDISSGCPVLTQTWSPSFPLDADDAIYGRVSAGSANARVFETGL